MPGFVERNKTIASLPSLGLLTLAGMTPDAVEIGYFEVDPDLNPTTNTHELLQEIGADTGEIERHRSFYIIDRSIPVAYEPGENHNVRKCILLERFIE